MAFSPSFPEHRFKFLRDLSTFPPHVQLPEAEQDGHQPPQPPEGWRSPQPHASPQRPPRAISSAPAVKAIFSKHPISLCFSRHTHRGRAEGPGEAPPTPGVAPPPIKGGARRRHFVERARGRQPPPVCFIPSLQPPPPPCSPPAWPPPSPAPCRGMPAW